MKPLRILHIVPSIGKRSFGLGQISVSLARAQYALGHDVTIWCFDYDEDVLWASETHDFPIENIRNFKLSGPRFFLYCPEMKKYASHYDKIPFDIVHQHQTWTGISNTTLFFSKKNIQTIISPHGSLDQYSLNISKWKKKLALAVYERRNLKHASCLHATSGNEIPDFRKFGLINPIAFINNGINEKNLDFSGDANKFREQYNIENNKRILLFLSRISQIKGLDMLIHAINSIKDDFTDWQLIIAGNDESEYKKEVEELIVRYNLEDSIKIIGPQFNQDKNDAFAAAELFILPSYSEGSPMVVLDSLAAGVPVITTKASTWNDLIDYNCGWWTEINETAITIALKEAINMSTEDLYKKGDNGKKLVALKYTWSCLSQKSLELYNWLLGNSKKPDFVQID